MPKLLIILACLSYLMFSCDDKHNTFGWLTGIWQLNKHDGSSRLEIWNFKDDTTLTGRGLKVSGGDTIQLEEIELTFKDHAYWYIPTVPDQNNALPVPFKLVKTENHLFVFENQEHDFPQRIIYQLKPITNEENLKFETGDTLFVRVESWSGEGLDYIFLRK